MHPRMHRKETPPAIRGDSIDLNDGQVSQRRRVWRDAGGVPGRVGPALAGDARAFAAVLRKPGLSNQDKAGHRTGA